MYRYLTEAIILLTVLLALFLLWLFSTLSTKDKNPRGSLSREPHQSNETKPF